MALIASARVQPIPEPTADLPLDILVIFTRDPRGRMTGRKMVLTTILKSLGTLGHRVSVAHFGAPEGPEMDGGVRYIALPAPGGVERLLACGTAFAFGHGSINEGLYRSRDAEKVIDALVARHDFDLVVTDMVRTAPYGARTGLPWIADLDDLLSTRYRLMAENDTTANNLFGYYESSALRAVGRLFGFAQPLFLRRESVLLSRRERQIAAQAHAVTLVSPSEAAALSRLTGRPVAATPMAVPGPDHVPPLANRPNELVFLGGMDYGPNLNSVRSFDLEIRPAVEAQGLAGVTLDVIGFMEPNHARDLSPAVTFRGYVDDLDGALRTYRAMLVPEVAPGGIKTKIVTAALNGTVVFCHHTALDGMALTDGRNVLAWSSAGDLADLITALRAGRIDLEALAAEAHAWALAHFGEARLRDLWARNIADCRDAAMARAG